MILFVNEWKDRYSFYKRRVSILPKVKSFGILWQMGDRTHLLGNSIKDVSLMWENQEHL